MDIQDDAIQHCLEHGEVCINEYGVEYLKAGDVVIKGDWEGCDRSVPEFSVRFGERRRWHKRYEFLYYDEKGGIVAPFTFTEQAHPALQNLTGLRGHTNS
jgi:hypothetical protein